MEETFVSGRLRNVRVTLAEGVTLFWGDQVLVGPATYVSDDLKPGL